MEDGDEVSVVTKKVLDGLKGVEEMKSKAEVKEPVKVGKVKDKDKKAVLDDFGFRLASKTHEAVKMLETGKHTMADVKKKFSSTFYGALKQLGKRGHFIERRKDGTYCVKKEK